DPTIYWYRFIAIDGTATAYYEDDGSRDGGWGQTFAESQDNSWQLTVYNPAFHTPDWVKNAIIYQIFPDRFRDGDGTNDPEPGRFFYDEAGGTIYRSDPTGSTSNDWNTPVCDPRSAIDCPGDYSNNFYGGDLQGVIDKLDYLQELGVTAIYFNPIFESPSNHKYDTADYNSISADFGDLTTFQTLATETSNRGMSIILDGVFNHTSSDSIYFDRYSNFPEVGACESETSPYRDWYYFTDVTPGTGPCVGSDGTPNAATYESWFGFDSLPKLQANSQAVRDLIWDDGSNSVGVYWLSQGADGWRFDVGGDVDPGTANDPTNDYWEGFRSAVRAVYPDAYMTIEEWGNASSWLLGDEMDATMNYQYSSAMLSFWRDTTFTDNDHNEGSSAGALVPLTPSELDGRLQNWIERYPPEALYAMMNLLGSHDTNRPLFFLDHNAANGTDATPLLDPNYDWSDSVARLKGVVLLQMTLPGAPTIYYGDEVGLVGPTYYYGGKWEDDPYNRQPFPWLDESGTPFYTFLQTPQGQDNLRDYYKLLTAARNAHPALRTGSFDTLLVDDANEVYAYGRLQSDYSDAAIVIVNRMGTIASPVTQTVTLDVNGYLPVGATFTETLSGDVYAVAGDGTITLDVPGESGALLVLAAPMVDTPPDAVTDLAVTASRSGELDLGWSAAAGATSYDLYRSLVSGGGYTWISNTTTLTYTDSGLTNAQTYYYVIISKDDGSGLSSDYSNEASGIPAYDLTTAWYNLQWPPSINHTISTITPTDNIYGQIYIAGGTEDAGPPAGVSAQVGYGISGTLPVSWMNWVDMGYQGQSGSNDEFVGNFLPDELGVYQYTTRYSSDGGHTWYYALSGPNSSPDPLGVMTVTASSDVTPPAAPLNLVLDGTTPASISFSWDAVADADLAGYEIYRDGGWLTAVSTATTSYTDEDVVSDNTYEYFIKAYDTSFNRSDPSNTITATAEARLVTVTFRVGVPAYTPGTVYVAGDISEFGPWNPGQAAMTQINDTTWELTLPLLDGTQLQYKYARGSWDTVESWGSITGLNNRSVTIDYGTDGTQLVDDTATDWGTGADIHKAVQFWRDPIVVDYAPAAGATAVSLDTAISVTWSITMTADTDFVVTGPAGVVSCTFANDDLTWTTVFTPDAPLEAAGTYTVTVAGQQTNGVPGGDSGVQQVPVTWQFTTAPITITAGFTSNSPVTVGDTAVFTNTTTGTDPISYEWDFGDGSA
ncbi:MAG: Ig-like domain-containing protein, partial [Anaerolineales bacterium]|nr:Ig-like domain-containing protein [Anaerolineales bacterium]